MTNVTVTSYSTGGSGGENRLTEDEFRSSYVLTFTPKGVKAAGWHTLTVKTQDPLRRLRWRSGYEGG